MREIDRQPIRGPVASDCSSRHFISIDTVFQPISRGTPKRPAVLAPMNLPSDSMAGESTKKNFDREFRSQLERFTQPLVSALRKIVSAHIPQPVAVLSFEMQSDWS